MGIDLTIPLYTLLAIECLVVALACMAGYFILRQTVRGLKALTAYLQLKKASQNVQEPGLSNEPGAA